jgi:hypothetical protein
LAMAFFNIDRLSFRFGYRLDTEIYIGWIDMRFQVQFSRCMFGMPYLSIQSARTIVKARRLLCRAQINRT